MEKKEFKVGEVFTAGLVRLKCVEGDTYVDMLIDKITRMLFLLKLIKNVHQFQTTCSIRHDS